MKLTDIDKHSSLLPYIINYDRKKSYDSALGISSPKQPLRETVARLIEGDTKMSLLKLFSSAVFYLYDLYH
jgi:hypothetical protein